MSPDKSQHERVQPADLSWLALQYVSGELSVGETAAFEERLARDDGAGQLAREAVAQMVELEHAVAIAEGMQAPQHAAELPAVAATAAPWRRLAVSSAWMTVGAAVALAVVLAWRPLAPGTPDPREVASPQAPREAQELASHWVSLPEDAAAAATDVGGHSADSHDQAVALALADASLDDSDVDVNEDAVPSWLLAALAPEGDAEHEERN